MRSWAFKRHIAIETRRTTFFLLLFTVNNIFSVDFIFYS